MTRLHKEICDFYEFVRPLPHEEECRQDLVSRLSNIVLDAFPHIRARLYVFGSFASGLYLPTADMDLVVISDQFQQSGKVALGSGRTVAVARRLRAAGGFSHIVAITKAKVPIVKFVDDRTNLRVDISFDNSTGLVALGTFKAWKSQFPAMVPLVAVIKQFLLMRNLNEVFLGGLGGFSITCLVISLFQHHPAIQSGKMKPEHHLGQLLIEFFDLYGNKFNMDTTGITMNPPGYFPKVENPFLIDYSIYTYAYR
jgi:non-canonical poly(A) RNA polymerase PAPD5/7